MRRRDPQIYIRLDNEMRPGHQERLVQEHSACGGLHDVLGNPSENVEGNLGAGCVANEAGGGVPRRPQAFLLAWRRDPLANGEVRAHLDHQKRVRRGGKEHRA